MVTLGVRLLIVLILCLVVGALGGIIYSVQESRQRKKLVGEINRLSNLQLVVKGGKMVKKED